MQLVGRNLPMGIPDDEEDEEMAELDASARLGYRLTAQRRDWAMFVADIPLRCLPEEPLFSQLPRRTSSPTSLLHLRVGPMCCRSAVRLLPGVQRAWASWQTADPSYRRALAA